MSTVISKLADELKGTLPASVVVVTPESEKYKESIKRWSSSAERPAGLVVYPTSAEDVSKVVVFGIAKSLDIVVVGGGHSTSGSSSTNGGVVIDLSKLRACTVDVKKKTVSVQGGALWKDVDEALGVYDLATVGGTVNHTGVGGLTLGGGFGWLSPEYGLVIDNLLAVELVLADGSIVNASSTENQDLFWAARGAGQAFGVATNFVFQAYEQKNAIWGGMIIFPPTQLKEVFEASDRLVVACTGKSQLGIGFVAPPPDFHPCLGALMFYNGSEEEGKKFFEPLYSLKPLADMTSVMPYDKANSILNDFNPHGFRRSMKGSAFFAPIDPAIPEVLFHDYVKFIQDVPDAAATAILFEYFSARKIIQVPQRETAFANRGSYLNINFSACWTKEENDVAGREWVRTSAAKTKEFLKIGMAKGTDSVTQDGVGEYANYDSVGEKGQVLFGVNFPRLVELKRRYDPGNVFGKNLNLL